MAPKNKRSKISANNYDDRSILRSNRKNPKEEKIKTVGEFNGGLGGSSRTIRLIPASQDLKKPSEAKSMISDLGTGSNGFSSDERDKPVTSKQKKSYDVLLQSLNTSSSWKDKQSKKRKLEESEHSRTYGVSAEDLDDASVSDENENSGFEKASDLEDVSGAEEVHDPYMRNSAKLDEGVLSQAIESVKKNEWNAIRAEIGSSWTSLLKMPKTIDSSTFRSEVFSGPEHLKQKLRPHAAKLLPVDHGILDHFSSAMFDYKDVLFAYRTPKNAEILRKLICLHSLNHILKIRDKVIKNNARISREDGKIDVELRDQGFTRPKVLVVLPTRQSCVKYVEYLISFAEPQQQENKKRFQASYNQKDDGIFEHKPEDFKELFGGNDDDMFRLGLKFTRKTLKFFSPFYSSDVIFASPLGLRMALKADNLKEKDADFLSSIELVVLDQCEALMMQNWEHIEIIFNHLNLQPKEAHGCDFGRVKNYYLDGNSKHLRQTILLSAFNFPLLNRLYTQFMQNIEGKIKYHKDFEGAIIDLGIKLKQTFSRFHAASLADDADDRFEFFSTVILPALIKRSKESNGFGQGTLIFFPAYADFVRIRNFLARSPMTQGVSFGSISEYTPMKDVARARSHFTAGRHSILLYTERAHHFRRYPLKGVKAVIMYGLPENPLFYKEIAGGYLQASLNELYADLSLSVVRNIFSKFDILKLERIVGTQRYMSLCNSKAGDTFDFV